MTTTTTETAPAKRPRGRPKGSRTRPPLEAAAAIKPMAMRLDVAAKALGISLSTLLRLINQGALEAVRIGNMRVIPTASLDALLQRGIARIER